MRTKVFMLCGVLAPVVYVLAVIIGGLLRPGYNHVSQYISELLESGAPNKPLLDPMFALFNVLTLAFALGLFAHVRGVRENKAKTIGSLGALILAAEGVFGFVTVLFPQDPIGAPATFTGTMHIVLATGSSVTTMLAMLLMGFWFRSIPTLRGYGAYSFISVIVVFLSGGLAAATIANPSPVAGLIERITIGGFLIWEFVIALKMYTSEARRSSSRSQSGAKADESTVG